MTTRTVRPTTATIRSPTTRVRTLTYVSMGRRAQAQDLKVEVSLAQIDRHVRSAIHNPIANEQTNNTLFELLLPNEAKLELESFDNLHLLVDESTAFIPWEMIAGRESTGQLSQPLAVRAGLLRQLKPRREEAPRKHLRPVGQEVLVIGDPPSGREGVLRLPGAQQEARLVADLLGQQRQFNVTECIFGSEAEASESSTQSVLDAFFSHHYRMIHIAAHGQFDAASRDPLRNGVVIGTARRARAGAVPAAAGGAGPRLPQLLPHRTHRRPWCGRRGDQLLPPGGEPGDRADA